MTGIAGAADHTPDGTDEPTCYVCRQPFGLRGSYAARALPGVGVVQVCSEACAGDRRFAGRLVLRTKRKRKERPAR